MGLGTSKSAGNGIQWPVWVRQQRHKIDMEDGSSSATWSSFSNEHETTTTSSPPASRELSWISRLNPGLWSRKMRIFALTASTLALLALIIGLAVPLSLAARDSTRNASKPLLISPPATSVLANNTALRIMPLGASITYGFRSTDGNGYRNDLLALVTSGGNTNVTYVGSRHNGTMANNAVEGWPGFRIDQVLAKARVSVPKYLPNVILLNVGTNDAVQNFDMDGTDRPSLVEPGLTANKTDTVGTRLKAMVEDLLEWSPGAVVVMSTLINNMNASVQVRVRDANSQFRAVEAQLRAEGRRVVLAEMDAAVGGPNKTTMVDQTHPDDTGYSLMANRWYEALRNASDNSFIVQAQALPAR